MKITERERLRRRVLIEFAKLNYLENVYGTYNERTTQASYNGIIYIRHIKEDTTTRH